MLIESNNHVNIGGGGGHEGLHAPPPPGLTHHVIVMETISMYQKKSNLKVPFCQIMGVFKECMQRGYI